MGNESFWPETTQTGKLGTYERRWGEGWFYNLHANDAIIRCDTVTISNAEIKALRAAPKTLIAAPGAGKFIQLVSAVLLLNYGSNALTESADDLQIRYTTSNVAAAAAIDATGFITATADTMIWAAVSALTAQAATDLANKAIELQNAGDGEYAGNVGVDTTLIVKVSYRVWETGL